MQDEAPTSTLPFKGILDDANDGPASGCREIRWSGRADPELWQMPFYGSHPSLALRRPVAYWVPS